MPDNAGGCYMATYRATDASVTRSFGRPVARNRIDSLTAKAIPLKMKVFILRYVKIAAEVSMTDSVLLTQE